MPPTPDMSIRFINNFNLPLPASMMLNGEPLPVRLPISYDSEALSRVLNDILQTDHSFDFIIQDHFLKSSLSAFLEKIKWNAEVSLDVVYQLGRTKPSLGTTYPTNEWIKSVHISGDGTKCIYSGSFDGILRSHDVHSETIGSADIEVTFGNKRAMHSFAVIKGIRPKIPLLGENLLFHEFKGKVVFSLDRVKSLKNELMD